MRSVTTVGLAVASLSLLLAVGCSNEEKPTATAEKTVSKAPVVKTVNATKQLQGVTCEHGDAGWSFDGTIRNTGVKASTYTVTVRIAPRKNQNSTIGLASMTKKVEPGRTARFRAENFSTLKEQGNVCLSIATRVV